MGLFGGDPLEQQLEATYRLMYEQQGQTSEQAEKMARELISLAKKDVHARKKTPPQYGDYLLQRALTDDDARKAIESKRREGVTDSDVRWWWNLSDLERSVLNKHDEISRLSLFMFERERGLNSEEAATKVRRAMPIYGNPTDLSHTSGDDRPLPYELKDRVNIYIGKNHAIDRDAIKRRVESFSIFNAFVRSEIKLGRL